MPPHETHQLCARSRTCSCFQTSLTYTCRPMVPTPIDRTPGAHWMLRAFGPSTTKDPSGTDGATRLSAASQADAVTSMFIQADLLHWTRPFNPDSDNKQPPLCPPLCRSTVYVYGCKVGPVARCPAQSTTRRWPDVGPTERWGPDPPRPRGGRIPSAPLSMTMPSQMRAGRPRSPRGKPGWPVVAGPSARFPLPPAS
jgi:hypothetical protein